jgi:alpha-1,6-mannosyltransferase
VTLEALRTRGATSDHRLSSNLERDRAYLALAACVFAALFVFTTNQQWAGDFFEHLAVVREVSRRPWNPRHPLFDITAPHPFAGPYVVLAGLAARALHVTPLTVMATAGMLNLLMLLAGFRLFVGAALGTRTAFYGLLFTLLLWGRDPWLYSGFLHLRILGFVLAYPSIFGMAVALLSFYAYVRYLEQGSWRWGVLVVCGAALVVLSHPITSIVMAVGLVALSVPALSSQRSRVLKLGTVLTAACLVCAVAWPYYPWVSLILSGSRIYRDPNVRVYESVLQRTWPVLVAFPFVWRRWQGNPRDWLSWFVAGLLALYALGAFLQNGPLGRVLPALVLSLHLVLADAVAHTEARWTAASLARRLGALRAGVALAAIAGLVNIAPGLIRLVPRGLLPSSLLRDPRLERQLDLYTPAISAIGPDDVVMADASAALILPGLAGKVVGFSAPEAFVPDELVRRDAIGRFFGPSTTGDRRALLTAYHASFVVLDRQATAMTPELTASLHELGDDISDDGRVAVIRVRAERQ